MKAMKEFGYNKHRYIQNSDKDLREFLAKVFIDLKLLKPFSKISILDA